MSGGKSQQFTIPRIDTVFNFSKPGPPLSEFVDSFWLYESHGTQHKIERILPTGTLELAINLRRNELSFYDAERPENRSRLSGAVVSGAHGRGFFLEFSGLSPTDYINRHERFVEHEHVKRHRLSHSQVRSIFSNTAVPLREHDVRKERFE